MHLRAVSWNQAQPLIQTKTTILNSTFYFQMKPSEKHDQNLNWKNVTMQISRRFRFDKRANPSYWIVSLEWKSVESCSATVTHSTHLLYNISFATDILYFLRDITPLSIIPSRLISRNRIWSGAEKDRVADGDVPTEEQFDYLKSLNMTNIQLYSIDKH